MKAANLYMELDGTVLMLTGLDAAERQLLARLRRRARIASSSDAFDNYWTRAVPEFYEARGLPYGFVSQTLAWRIAQGLSSWLGIEFGQVRPPDYRDDLDELIRVRYRSPEAFCAATGFSKEMLKRALAGRDPVSLTALSDALGRIGYRLMIAPAIAKQRTGEAMTAWPASMRAATSHRPRVSDGRPSSSRVAAAPGGNRPPV